MGGSGAVVHRDAPLSSVNSIPFEISAFQRRALIFDGRIFRCTPVTGRAAIVFFSSVLPVRNFSVRTDTNLVLLVC